MQVTLWQVDCYWYEEEEEEDVFHSLSSSIQRVL